jgi:hypothetical protein
MEDAAVQTEEPHTKDEADPQQQYSRLKKKERFEAEFRHWHNPDPLLPQGRMEGYRLQVEKAEKEGAKPSISCDLLEVHARIGEEEWDRLRRSEKIDQVSVEHFKTSATARGCVRAIEERLRNRQEDILCASSVSLLFLFSLSADSLPSSHNRT